MNIYKEYKFCIISSIQELLTYNDLIHDAYMDYEDRDLLQVPEIEFIKTLMDCVGTPDYGFLLVVKNKNNLVLGMGAVQYINKERAHVYSGWHNQKDPFIFRIVFEWLDKYLQRKGFKFYTFSTRRSSGAAKRCFINRYGFKQDSITFRKDI